MAIAWQLINQRTSVDLAPNCDRGFALSQVAFPRASRLTFRIDDPTGTVDIDEEDEIILVHGATRIFAGFVRELGRSDVGVTTHRVYEIECQDYTSLLVDDVVDTAAGNHAGGISDRDLIVWLFATYGTKGVTVGASVATLRASMPAIDFRGMTLFEALEAIKKVTGAYFFVGYDVAKSLTYKRIRDIAAPFALSDAPNDTTTFPYWDFNVPSSTNELVNAVYIQGDGIAGWVEETTSQTLYGVRRGGALREPGITASAALNDRGDEYLELNAWAKLNGGFKTAKAGLRAGMTVDLTHQGWGYSAEGFPIAQLDIRPAGPDRIEYTVRVGEPPKTLAEIVARVTSDIRDTQQRVDDLEDSCGCPPYECDPDLYKLPTDGGGGVAVIQPGATQGASPGYFTLYGGATYSVGWVVYHGTGSVSITAGISRLTGIGGVVYAQRYFGSLMRGTNYSLAQDFFTASDDGTYNVGVGDTDQPYPGRDPVAASAGASVYYISGPDPRFVDLGTCPPPHYGQTIPNEAIPGAAAGATRTLNHPYLPGSLTVRVGGVDVIATPIDPAAGTYSLPVDTTGRVEAVSYAAAGLDPTGENNPTAAANDEPPPYYLLGAGGDGSGDNVLHDDGTWGPSDAITDADAADPIDRAITASVAKLSAVAPTFVQVKTATASFGNAAVTLDAPATAGNLLVAWHSARSLNTPTAPTGFTAHPLGTVDGGVDRAAMFWKVAVGGESVISGAGVADRNVFSVAEFAMTPTLDDDAETTGSSASIVTGSVTPSGGAPVLIVGGAVIAISDGSGVSVSPDGGWTELADATAAGFHPLHWMAYQIVASPSGSYDPAGTATASAAFGGQTLAFEATAGTWTVPTPEVIDGDDATYNTVTGPDVLRAGLLSAKRIVRSRLRIATATAGSRTYTIKGANLNDFSDEVTLASVTFTAVGSNTPQDVEVLWVPPGAFEFYELSGDNETRRIHSWELYEAAAGTLIVGDPTTGNAAELQTALDNIDTVTDGHIADAADAHDASAVSFVPAGTIAATNVQAAIEEVAAEAGVTSENVRDAGRWEVMLVDGITPPEPMTTEDETDWLYAWIPG